ncbi:MAG: hypothetical protein GX667_08210 [Xanthomonadaceae bacterium]|nr:hypothetical protein [Xanthomonadaceae bacterium]
MINLDNHKDQSQPAQSSEKACSGKLCELSEIHKKPSSPFEWAGILLLFLLFGLLAYLFIPQA